MTTTADRIRTLVIEHLECDPENVTDDATFESLGADSLDTIEITMAVEQAFDIEVPDDELFEVGTIAKAAALVDKKLAAV